jgi:hypothetical protein
LVEQEEPENENVERIALDSKAAYGVFKGKGVTTLGAGTAVFSPIMVTLVTTPATYLLELELI